ncbi:hypothetical protein QQ045_028810 [Rhodiola kirilowii]
MCVLCRGFKGAHFYARLMYDMKRYEESDKCFILDFDPYEAADLVNGKCLVCLIFVMASVLALVSVLRWLVLVIASVIQQEPLMFSDAIAIISKDLV